MASLLTRKDFIKVVLDNTSLPADLIELAWSHYDPTDRRLIFCVNNYDCHGHDRKTEIYYWDESLSTELLMLELPGSVHHISMLSDNVTGNRIVIRSAEGLLLASIDHWKNELVQINRSVPKHAIAVGDCVVWNKKAGSICRYRPLVDRCVPSSVSGTLPIHNTSTYGHLVYYAAADCRSVQVLDTRTMDTRKLVDVRVSDVYACARGVYCTKWNEDVYFYSHAEQELLTIPDPQVFQYDDSYRQFCIFNDLIFQVKGAWYRWNYDSQSWSWHHSGEKLPWIGTTGVHFCF